MKISKVELFFLGVNYGVMAHALGGMPAALEVGEMLGEEPWVRLCRRFRDFVFPEGDALSTMDQDKFFSLLEDLEVVPHV